MTETIFITTEQNQNNTSTLAQQQGGLVAVSCQVFIDQSGGLSITKSDSTIGETQGLKLAEWYSDNDYIGSETEKAFSTNGKMVEPDTYMINGSFDGDVGILNKNPNLDVWVIGKDGALKFQPKP